MELLNQINSSLIAAEMAMKEAGCVLAGFGATNAGQAAAEVMARKRLLSGIATRND